MSAVRHLLRVGAATLVCAACAEPQQLPDRDYRPAIPVPTHAQGTGPTVCLDEAHHNFHTLDNRFWAFGDLLRRDGYVVRPLRARFGPESLASCAILVISNAQPNDDGWDSYPSPTPAAFTTDEVGATRAWVESGGRLLLIADHMPLAGAAASLAAAFDVTFTDGFAVEGFSAASLRDAAFAKPTIFRTEDQTLRAHPIVNVVRWLAGTLQHLPIAWYASAPGT